MTSLLIAYYFFSLIICLECEKPDKNESIISKIILLLFITIGCMIYFPLLIGEALSKILHRK